MYETYDEVTASVNTASIAWVLANDRRPMARASEASSQTVLTGVFV